LFSEAWASERGGRGGLGLLLDFEIIGKKRLFFQFRGVKTKFNHFWPPPGKNFGKIPYLPPLEKILPTTAGLRGGSGGNCPGPPAKRRPPMMIFICFK